MVLMYLPYFLFFLGLCSVLLWLPAYGLGIFLLIREKGCRRVLGVLFTLWVLAAALVLLLPRAEEAFGFRLRNWLHAVPVYLWAILSIILLLCIAWYGWKRFSKAWVRLCLKLGCVLTVLAVIAVGGYYLVFTARPEEVGTWQGQQVVMQKSSWRDATYSYYRYQGPFLLGEPLGWSEGPWELREWG